MARAMLLQADANRLLASRTGGVLWKLARCLLMVILVSIELVVTSGASLRSVDCNHIPKRDREREH